MPEKIKEAWRNRTVTVEINLGEIAIAALIIYWLSHKGC